MTLVKVLISALIAALVAAGIIVWYFILKKSPVPVAPNNSPVATSSQQQTNNTMEIQNMKITDITVGSGEEAKNGDVVTVNYVGTLDNGQVFDSSYSRNQPFVFTLGAGQVIKGWDLGVVGMKIGGKRQLIISPALAYGANGVPPVIPPNATLTFTVELLKVSSQ